MPGRSRTRSALTLLLLLVAAWLLWSGLYKPLLLVLGAFSCLLSLFIAERVGFFKRSTGMHLVLKLPRYWLWLIVEIVKSSLEVVRIVLANSITLTPGTVTLDVFDNHVLVHCLTEEGARAIQAGDANRRAAELTGK